MTNKSPPMPLLIGSTRPFMALAAMAASTALPPRLQNVEPDFGRQRCTGATMPCLATVTERLWVGLFAVGRS